jgi:hypothetical protein
VALVDGNAAQIETITAGARRRQVQVHIICDFIRVLEYLWKAAWSFFEPGDRDAVDWVAGQVVKIPGRRPASPPGSVAVPPSSGTRAPSARLPVNAPAP